MSKDIAKKNIKEIRDLAEINEAYLIGLLWGDPYENYSVYQNQISSSDFLHKVWAFHFELGKRLYLDGVKQFDDITVYAKTKELGIEKSFEEYGGKSTIDEAVEIVRGNELNIEYYYESLKKNSTIYSLIELFGPKVIVPNGKYDFNNMSRVQLMTYWMDKLNKINLESVNNYEVDNLYVSAEEFIEQSKENAGNMLKFYNSNLLNSITQGIPRGEITMIGGFGGNGKALDINCNIPTINGWRKARDIKVGDKLFDRLGRPTTVLGVFPQGELKAYEVTLEDGRSFVVNDEHIIPYFTSRGNISSKTLKEMMKDYMKYYYRADRDVYDRFNKYKIPNNEAVKYEEKEFLISPYALGVLLGDGSLSLKMLTVSNNELDVVDNLAKELGLNTPEKSIYNYNWTFTESNNNNTKVKVKEYKDEIVRLGLNKTSLYKFIPKQYLLGSKEQRLELLRGLMDTDGCVNITPNGVARFSFSTNSEQLAKDVVEISYSLGYGATLSKSVRDGRVNPEYGVRIHTSDVIASSKKHLEKLESATKFSHREKGSYIVDIKEVESREMVCFKVDNEESLFLMNDYIVTHNTSFTAEKVVMGCVDVGEKAMVVLNEEGAHSFRQKIVLSILNHEFHTRVDRAKMINGTMGEKDLANIHKAFDKMKELMDGDESLIKIIYMEKYDMDDLEKIVKHWANRGYSNLFIDTHKISDNYKTDKRWEAFVEDTKRIHKWTRAEAGGLNLRTVLTFQLADAHIGDRFLGFDAIGEGKMAKNEAGIVLMFRPLFGDEYEKLEVTKNVKMGNSWVKESVELNKEKTYYLLFVPKNRYGRTTDNGQPVLVMDVNFDFNSFREVGWTFVSRNYNGR